MRSQLTSFVKSLPVTAAIFGQKLGVKVILGNGAYTDGDTIVLPKTFNEQVVTQDELLGLVLHESCHVRFTNFSAAQAEESSLHHDLSNALEDARIEREIASVYNGSSYIFSKIYDPLIKSFLDPNRKLPIQALYGLFVAASAQATHSKRFQPLVDHLRPKCIKQFGQELVLATENELKCFPALKNTEEVVESSRRLLRLIEKSNPIRQQQQQQQQQQGNSQQQNSSESSGSGTSFSQNQSNNSDNDSEKNSASSQTGVEKQDGESSSQTNAGESNSSEMEENGSSGSSSDSSEGVDSQKANGKDPSSLTKTEQALGKRLERLLKSKPSKSSDTLEFSQNVSQRINETVPDNVKCERDVYRVEWKAPVKPDMRKYTRCCNHGLSLLREAKMGSVKLRRSLTGLLQTKANQGSRIASSGRKIQTSKISRLSTGNARIFERKSEITTENTAVCILLDASGSMAGHEMEVGVKSTLALLTAMQSVNNVKAGLTLFPGHGFRSSEHCVQIVPIGERPERYAGNIGFINASGGTPLAEALTQTACQLSTRFETRKIVIIITDGYVSDGDAETVKKLTDSGIVVACIGLGNYQASFKLLFPISTVIFNVDDLQGALVDLSKQLL